MLIYNHVSAILSPKQHGFIRKRSTETNFVTISQFSSETLDDQRQVDVILLCKLENFGLSDSLIRLIGSYLVGRLLFSSVWEGLNPACLNKTVVYPNAQS
jgi:hypothetical protein